jgi:hypothetical protein
MSSNDQCFEQCLPGYFSAGEYTCSHGEMLGGSFCIPTEQMSKWKVETHTMLAASIVLDAAVRSDAFKNASDLRYDLEQSLYKFLAVLKKPDGTNLWTSPNGITKLFVRSDVMINKTKSTSGSAGGRRLRSLEATPSMRARKLVGSNSSNSSTSNSTSTATTSTTTIALEMQNWTIAWNFTLILDPENIESENFKVVYHIQRIAKDGVSAFMQSLYPILNSSIVWSLTFTKQPRLLTHAVCINQLTGAFLTISNVSQQISPKPPPAPEEESDLSLILGLCIPAGLLLLSCISCIILRKSLARRYGPQLDKFNNDASTWMDTFPERFSAWIESIPSKVLRLRKWSWTRCQQSCYYVKTLIDPFIFSGPRPHNPTDAHTKIIHHR